MQIFVIGMHRSGTSMVCRLINLMGAYFGPEGCQHDPNEENPYGFWERKDFRALNDEVLEASGCSWDAVERWSLHEIDPERRDHFLDRARRLLFRLEGFRPWVTKEPRFCLTFPLFRPFCEAPIVVLVARHPAEVAMSLETRNGIPHEQGLDLWRRYVTSALEVTDDCPRLVVEHGSFLREPRRATQRLYASLRRLGATGLREPARIEIESFIRPSLYRSRPLDLALPADIEPLYETLRRAGD